jgi:hypothetical protein
MPFQIFLPWIIMLPMIYGSTLVSLPMFFAIFFAALGLSAMHFYQTVCTKPEE